MSTLEIKKNSVSQSRVPTEVGYDRGDTLFNDSISKKFANVNLGNKKEQCITVPSSHGSGVRQAGYTAQ